MSINLYMDTNVYLTFYHFTQEDLKELQKLIAFIDSGEINLYMPEQTFNEFHRNREVKIADSLSKIRGVKMNNQFPKICHNYDEFIHMKKAIKDFEMNKTKLLEKLYHDVEKEALAADDVLNQLISKADKIDTSEEILKLAVTRFDIGNPPGKDKSYGDAINWETLLSAIPDYEDLYFIAEDKDYYSKINDSNFNSFLLNEWKSTKGSELYFYKRLSEFFKDKYPDIELSSETEKEIVIKNLFEADSFYGAKQVVSKLLNFENFSIKQLNVIASAFSSNTQISWIGNDYPIRNIRLNIIEANKDKIEPSIYQDYLDVYHN